MMLPVALAALPPQKNVGTAARPMGSHRPVAAEESAPIPGWLAVRAIRFHCKSVTATRYPIQTKWLLLQSSNPGLPAAVLTHAKQRVTSNGLRSFRMWKHARANLCASALIATTLFVFAFFRS